MSTDYRNGLKYIVKFCISLTTRCNGTSYKALDGCT